MNIPRSNGIRLPILFIMSLVTVSTLSGIFSSSEAATTKPSVDTRIGRESCSLLGRAWMNGYTNKRGQRIKSGCSTKRCINGSLYLKRGYGAEVCSKNGKKGNYFGNTIEQRKCQALNRKWINPVNYCASNPYRAYKIIANAPQCVSPYTTYVTHSEKEGKYDECLRPNTVKQLLSIANRKNISFKSVSLARSKTLCSFRPHTEFVNGTCRTKTSPIDRSVVSGTLIVGDSITWRGSNELANIQPRWTIDGIPGRQPAELASRLNYYLKGHVYPKMLIVALGTNPSRNWQKADYEKAISRVPAATIVMFVTAYNEPGLSAGSRAKMSRINSDWMQEIAAERPNTCVADWRKKAIKNPRLLIDGTHPTPAGEKLWATFISKNASNCR